MMPCSELCLLALTIGISKINKTEKCTYCMDGSVEWRNNSFAQRYCIHRVVYWTSGTYLRLIEDFAVR